MIIYRQHLLGGRAFREGNACVGRRRVQVRRAMTNAIVPVPQSGALAVPGR